MMITLLKNVTYAGHNGGGLATDWVRIPEGNQVWQLIVVIHCFTAGTAGTVLLATSWDTALTLNPGAATSLATLGINPQDITTAMGPWIRVVINSTADSIVTISVFLTPKSD